MNIYKLDIPITDYYGGSISMYSHYFESGNSPTKEQIALYLQIQLSLVNEDTNPMARIDFDALSEALEIIKSCEEFPILTGGLFMKNTFVNHPKHGRQPLSITKIRPTNLQEFLAC